MKRSLSLGHKLQIAFVNRYSILALAILFAGVVMMYFIGQFGNTEDLNHIGAEFSKGTGEITDIYEANATSNEKQIYCFEYTFEYGGSVMNGKSYSTKTNYKQGDKVTILYDSNDASYHKIEGMDTAIMGMVTYFLFIPIPLFVGIVIFILISGAKKISLIQAGEIAAAVIGDTEMTNLKVNGKSLWKITFEFTDRSGSQNSATIKTLSPEKVTEVSDNMIIYDEANTSRIMAVNLLPKSVAEFVKMNG